NQVTVRVTDSGSPKLFVERTFNLTVNEVNIAPVLSVATAVLGGTPFADFEDFADSTYNGTVMFRQPSFSSTTIAHMNSTPNLTMVTENFPEGVPGGKVLNASFSFKTGTTNPWLRLTTFNTTAGNALPNPTIDFGKKLRFDIWTDRSLKVGLGVRETGSTAPIGADGGNTGTLEWIGATLNGGSPNPSRVVDETNWTTLEFDLPNEIVTAFPGSGNGTLSGGKGVLDHLALVPNAGTGTYTVYVDNFQVLSVTTNMVVDTGKTIILTNTATDADLPKQALTFTLEAGAPSNAIIDSKSGTLEWTPTPAQSPSTNVIGIRVTDDGVPALSDVKTVTIRVNKINTKPRMVDYLAEFFITPGELVEYDASATDADLPADSLSFSFVGTAPAGATLNSVSGHFAWTPSTANGTNYITIRVTDTGSPALSDELTLVIVVVPTNAAPVLSLGTARVTEAIANFETFANNTADGAILFRQPGFSSSTANYLTTATNFSRVTNSFPAGNVNAGGKVLVAQWTFKTGISNYWVRLATSGATSLPNPTVDLGARVKFDIYATKALKVGLGIRETGTTAEIGADGGTTGSIEWLGLTGLNGTSPNPSRTVAAGTWTTLEFDLPSEPCTNFSGGNSVLASGKGVLEHLALVGAGGTGAYTVYVDNLQVVTTTPLPGTVTMKSSSTLSFTASGTDPEGTALTFGLELGAPAGASISSGAFTWTPDVSFNGTTNDITVYAEDTPSGGSVPQRDYKTVTVVVNADAVGALSAGLIASNETVSLEWNTIPGHKYQIQTKPDAIATEWNNSGEPIIASSEVSSAVINNSGVTALYRIVDLSIEQAQE
ncbi:MAG: hypothetical protein JWM68_3919, partial [Verrucomicrobiales bacterium]|nr:hypothetical protein [Verrucomicrobiales bacterium]